MLLAVDAGNTNIVFAVCDGGEIRVQWRTTTKVARTADEYAVWLAQLLKLEGLGFDDLTEAIIATVVPAVLFDLRALCRNYLKCEPLLVGDPALDLGPKPRVDRPETVGADRLCNTVAAHASYRGAVIVVDFGTATNFDIVAEDGAFDGSVIAPGANLSIEALHQAAALLPRVAAEGDRRSLTQLKRLTKTDGCGFLGLRDCWPCLHKGKALRAAITRLEARLAAPPRP